jgi:ribonuclease HI
MELSAAINALAYVDENGLAGPVVVLSDSKYVIQGITSWVSGWQKNGWKTTAKKDVENKDLWEALHFVASGLSITWQYVQGHAGYGGNERCDEIATGFADKENVSLYHGLKNAYQIDLDAKSADVQRPKKSKNSGAKAYSYLSLVDGVLETHATWSECEARVKGVKDAKFKKSVSPEDERAIITGWGL